MSNTIDTRVVEMQFDNAAFEQGVRTSVQSLRTLDKSIENSAKVSTYLRGPLQAVSSMLGKVLPVDQITSAAGAISSTVQSIFSSTFNAVSSVAKVGLASLTAMGGALTAMAASGGMKRALNIEQARFQLAGLGVEWDRIKGDINYAVEGTAYGLDAAAKAASQLVASNVEIGDSMKTALRGISGVAAMTNREYEDVSHIFTTIAGQGKVGGMQLTQLATYGLNAAAILGKALDKTEAEIRDMVSKGQIDFATFAKAMDDAFGQHAKDANKTFTGAMSNVKAALSRVGEGFATPFIENSIEVMNSFREVVNTVKTGMGPIYEEASSVMEQLRKKIVDFFSQYTGKESAIDEMGGYIVTEAELTASRLEKIFQSILRIGHHFSGGIGSVFKSLGDIFNKTFRNISPLRDLSNVMYDIAGYVEKTFNFPKTFLEFPSVFYDILDTVRMLGSAIKDVSSVAFPALVNVAENLSPVFAELVKIWNAFIRTGIQIGTPLVKGFFSALEKGSQIIRAIQQALFNVGISSGSISLNLNKLATNFTGFISEVGSFISELVDLDAVLSTIGSAFTTVYNAAKTAFSWINSNLIGIIADALQHSTELISTSISAILEGLGKADVVKNFFDLFKGLRPLDILSVFNFGALLSAAANVERIFGGIRAGFGELSKFESSKWMSVANFLGLGHPMNMIANAAVEMKNVMLQIQGEVKANVILHVAGAIASLAGAMLLMAAIDPDQLVTVSLGMAVAVASLVRIVQTLSGAFTDYTIKQLLPMVGILWAIGSSFVKVALAMRVLATMDLEKEVLPAVIGMGVIVASMAGVILAVSKLPVNKGSAAVVKSLAGTFLALSLTMKILSTIPFNEKMLSAISGMGIIVASMAALFAVLGGMKLRGGQLAGAALAFAALGPMFLMLSASLKIISTIDATSMANSVFGMLGIVAGLAGLLVILGQINVVKLALATSVITSMSVLLLALTASLTILSSMSFLSVGGAVVSIAATLLVLYEAMQAFSNPKLATGIPAVIALAGALLVLSVSLKLLSTINVVGAIAGIVALAGTLFVLGVAANIIPIPKLMALAGALVLIAASALMFGASFALVGAGILLIVTAITTLVALVWQIGTDIISVMRGLGVGIGHAIVGISTVIGDHASAIASAGANVVLAFAEEIGRMIPSLVSTGMVMLLGLLSGIANGIGEVISLGLQIITNLIIGIASGIGSLIDAGVQLITMLIVGMADALLNNGTLLVLAVKALVYSIIVTFVEGLAEIVKDIPGVGQGIADAMRGSVSDLRGAAEEASSEVHAAFEEKNADILNGTKETMDGVSGTISGSTPALAGASEKAASSTTASFLSKLGLDTSILGNLELTEDNIKDYIPILSELSGQSGDAILESFNQHTEDLPTDAEDISEAAANKMSSVDYETPGEDNADEYAKGLGNNAYKSEEEARDMAINAGDSAYGEAWRGGDAGSAFSSSYGGSIDTHGGDWNADQLGANAAAAVDSHKNDNESTGENMVSGLVQGIRSVWDWAVGVANSVGEAIAYAINAGAQVYSPSRITTEGGMYIIKGAVVGMRRMEGEAISTAEEIGYNTATALNGFSSLLDTIDWDANPTITPVLDTSLVERGLSQMDGFFSSSQARQASWASGNYAIGLNPASSNQNGNTNNITVTLNYDASADANELVLGIARALRSNALMEG